MRKIRIPRKKKKWYYREKDSAFHFPNVTKYQKYLYYLIIEKGMKYWGVSAEELCAFSCHHIDQVIWWNWVRLKHFGIAPQMSRRFEDYWNELKQDGIL